jgi:hypothetical protein
MRNKAKVKTIEEQEADTTGVNINSENISERQFGNSHEILLNLKPTPDK